MLLEPPYQINSSFPDLGERPRWRQMKCVFVHVDSHLH